MIVAFQGELGAYGDEAIRSKFGDEAEPLPCKSFRDLFETVATGRADCGLAPVENSQAGSINDVYDLLRQHDLYVGGEVLHPVNHSLMALPGQRLTDIKRVISHPQALAQCDQFLRELGVEIVATYDTAGSAKMIREQGMTGVAAVAGSGAAFRYELETLATSIQTIKDNITRFVLLQRTPAQREGGPHKTMLVMSLDHRPGSLYHAMGALAKRNINLTKLESRPARNRPWEYVFYMDFEGHREDQLVREALAELAGYTNTLKVLGSFVRDVRAVPSADQESAAES